MDRSRAKELVEANIDHLTKAMGIAHWRITVQYQVIEPSNPDGYVLGECKWMAAYNKAMITINFDAIADEQQLMEVLVHELLHVVVSPFCMYREATTQHIESGTPAAFQDARLWTFFMEQSLINLERMWLGSKEFWADQAVLAGEKQPDATPPQATRPE